MLGEHRLSSCPWGAALAAVCRLLAVVAALAGGAQAQQLSMGLVAPWHVDLPRPETEPVSLALACGF